MGYGWFCPRAPVYVQGMERHPAILAAVYVLRQLIIHAIKRHPDHVAASPLMIRESISAPIVSLAGGINAR